MPKRKKSKRGMDAGTVPNSKIKKMLGKGFMPPGKLSPRGGIPTSTSMMNGYKDGGTISGL